MDSTGDFTMSRFSRSPLTWALAAFLGMLGFQAGTYVGSLEATPDVPRTSPGGALSQQRALGHSPGSSTLENQALPPAAATFAAGH
jgi:hypothetical protein